MLFTSRTKSLVLDDQQVILNRSIGSQPVKDLFAGWQKAVLAQPERVTYAVISDITAWSGIILESDVRSMFKWSVRVHNDFQVPSEKLGRMAWIGRAGAGIDLLSDMFNKIRPEPSFDAATAEEAWALVMPGIPMPREANAFFKKWWLF
ncbi:MAG TPA: hypothetical protein HPP80_08020 [Rhodospirillaceae bacterium]|nr:hypothetical protein [Rhodospirillaceae bacterium]